LHRIAVVAIVLLRNLAPWVERIAVAGERADLQPAGGDGILESLPRRVVFEQRRGVRVGRSRIAPDPNLDCLATRGLDVVQRFLERPLTEQHREDPDFHVRTLSFFQICLTGSAHAEHRSNSSLDNHAACQPVATTFAGAIAICPILPKAGSPHRVPMRCSMINWFSFPVAPAAAGHVPDVDEMRFPRG
jgi:hypothetical protein